MLPFGFRVLDGKTGERQTIIWADAFRAHAECDDRAKLHRECYLSAFNFDDDFRAYLDSTGATKGFDGVCHAQFVWFDIDREDDPRLALEDTRRLITAIVGRYGIHDDDGLYFLSGGKGFHVGLPTCLWNPGPTLQFNLVVRRFAQQIADIAGVRIDTGVYAKVQLFRAPNSKHPKSGRHKRRFSFDEIMRLSCEYLIDLASTPTVFEIPAPTYPSDKAAEDWAEAEQQHKRTLEAKAERRAAESGAAPTINRQTLDFIRDGATEGDRHRLLFSAAANLSEFGCPPELAHALLTEAGRDAGLPPNEVRRQIECGLNYNRGQS